MTGSLGGVTYFTKCKVSVSGGNSGCGLHRLTAIAGTRLIYNLCSLISVYFGGLVGGSHKFEVWSTI